MNQLIYVFHRDQNFLIYISKYLQNIGNFGENKWNKIFNHPSLELRNVRASVINGTISG